MNENIDFKKTYDDIINQNPPYSEIEEKEIFFTLSKYKNSKNRENLEKAKKIIEEIALHNQKLVIQVINKIRKRRSDCKTISFEEMLQNGNIGLINAIKAYDLKRNTRFSTCAVTYIETSIIRGLDASHSLIVKPVHFEDELKHINKVKKTFFLKNGREMSTEELAHKLNISVEKLNEINSWQWQTISINSLVYQDSDVAYENVLSKCDDEKEASSPQNYVEKKELMQIVRNSLSILDKLDQEIIIKYYGLNGNKKETFQKISEKTKYSRETIRKRHNDALLVLKKTLENYNIESY